ncbi:hypothetical protein TTHERM_01001220 (macronuclear) [Tetrahymena thermophila SB210]|uniref:Uncharacterized protein n=1 Tax=Tetrahymena thermophila (strain SB210) TaxID=312017 RepID=Q24HK1_TETTS|nr:hypothetical protein TTHERM_01001220 [Tetrahymena thermophila SB210]6YNX_O Chain O, ATPTT9 [Tetrahymena thermophila]6YNX_o Chain o, ATPTT9 [Tetrahymena thermophila]6YNY_O Chain O, ATPTT9 [Tetrahymena thermophila]6YNY_o Chain o, ATPTT9 [Tetrahymena thermophila]6YNZ_O Chain O, ATPTT9 [Tetrahymena thermophila]6YNZ_O3 Chain O3, ATPTT9 [Tetrahymena thermophila]6YNZ_o Chain o, ATPTT9 [Tetrahymena thermophila]6YNZ_o3 Chain o3, ATPTT9 [Tetrahymena thermophila]EAS07230.3 hypothetical protein TTH|eukprot:XP_001027472.3 hypothetical protein TTHERM_01001220 [Tetrahymena thermophila SB210]
MKQKINKLLKNKGVQDKYKYLSKLILLDQEIKGKIKRKNKKEKQKRKNKLILEEMQNTTNIVHVPVHMGHTHYFDYIDSFPKLKEGPTLEENHITNQKILREQLISGQQGLEQNLCLRNCFKLSQKRYIEFCLDRKCGGADFQRAATILGYTKN